MNAFCLLIAGMYNNTEIDGLTQHRTISSVPYGGRFRLIDFILSSLVNANVPNIGIITRKNYKSLMDHLGWGKDWDLNRKNGGLKILTPMASGNEFINVRTIFESLSSQDGYIDSMLQDYCILAETNNVCNIDFKDMLNFHIEKQADITVVYKKKKIERMETEIIFDQKNRGYDSLYHHAGDDREGNVMLRIFIMKKDFLKNLINKAITLGWEDIARDYISKNFHMLNVYCYELKGYCATINSIENYFKANMELLNDNVREQLFSENARILTKIRDSVPTFYGENAKVKNTICGDGTFIDGTVENSIIFRDVKIAKGAVVKNSILFQGTTVEENAVLENVITDKEVTITRGKKMQGDYSCPFVIPKMKTI